MSTRTAQRVFVICRALVVLAFPLIVLAPAAVRAQAPFKRGDANVDDIFNLSDAIYVVERLFLSEEPLACEDAADIDDDGAIRVTDAIYAARFLFLGDEPPPSPLEECGDDPTADELGCAEFEHCAVDPGLCISQEILDDVVSELELDLGFTFCLPAGLLEFPLEALAVSVCSEESAPESCGLLEQPGCPIELTSIAAVLDTENAAVGIRISGIVADLPVDVTESFLNTTTTCETSLHGEGDASAPFSFDLVLPFELEEVGPGVEEIVGLGEAQTENVNLELESSGGIVCLLFQAGQGAFIEVLLLPLEQAANAIIDPLAGELTGLRLCSDAE